MGEVIRLGLIGAGRWGEVYLRTLRSLDGRARLTDLAVRHPEHLRDVPARVSIRRNWRQLIRADCDAVIIASPAPTHAEMLHACLDARKPCIVEKPLCLDVRTAEQLDRRVSALRVPVLVDHTQIFHPAYQALKRALAAAAEPIRFLLSEGMNWGPFRSDTPPLWDWGPHDVSLCLDLLGKAPSRVDALGGPANVRGAPQLITMRMAFPGGTEAWIYIGCLAPSKRRSLMVATATRRYVLDDTARQPLTVTRLTSTTMTPSPIRPVSRLTPMASMLLYFLKGLNGGDRTYFGTRLALEVTRVLAAADAAMRHG
jgi:predicted dehydrogenase